MLEEIEESEKVEQAVEGRLMLAGSSRLCFSIICAEGVLGGGSLRGDRGTESIGTTERPEETSMVGIGGLYGSVTSCRWGRVLLTL